MFLFLARSSETAIAGAFNKARKTRGGGGESVETGRGQAYDEGVDPTESRILDLRADRQCGTAFIARRDRRL